MARRKKIIRMIVHLSSTERVEFMYSTPKNAKYVRSYICSLDQFSYSTT